MAYGIGNSFSIPKINIPKIPKLQDINIPDITIPTVGYAPQQQQAPSYAQAAPAAAPVAAPIPQVVEPPKPTAPAFKDWLNSDGTTAAGKASVDESLQNSLAGMLADRNAYKRDNTKQTADIDRDAPEAFQDIAGDYAGRGLLQSSLYDQADDQAYEQVQGQKNDLQSALSDYLTNYDQGVTQQKTTAERDKRNLEASALQRYTSQFSGFNGFDTSTK
jgi:hypothetical protein